MGEAGQRHTELILGIGHFNAVFDIRHFLAERGQTRDAALGALHELRQFRTEQIQPRIGETAEIAGLERGARDDIGATEGAFRFLAVLVVARIRHVLRTDSAHVVFDVLIEQRPGARRVMRHHVFAQEPA